MIMTDFETRLLNLLKDTRDQLFHINDSIYQFNKTIKTQSEHFREIDEAIYQQTHDSTFVDQIKDIKYEFIEIAKILKNK